MSILAGIGELFFRILKTITDYFKFRDRFRLYFRSLWIKIGNAEYTMVVEWDREKWLYLLYVSTIKTNSVSLSSKADKLQIEEVLSEISHYLRMMDVSYEIVRPGQEKLPLY